MTIQKKKESISYELKFKSEKTNGYATGYVFEDQIIELKEKYNKTNMIRGEYYEGCNNEKNCRS